MADAQPASTITLYDRDAKPVEVSGDQAAALLRSGQYGLPEGATVPMQGADGSWEHVDAQTAVQRAQSYTARVGTAADVAGAQREKEFSGVGTKALAFGSGVADSLGLGFGDAGIVKAGEFLGYGDEARRFLEDADKYAPMARGAGKAAGFVAPLLISGGTAAGARGVVGTAARAATAPARALTAVAEGVGGAAGRFATAEGAPLLGRALAPALSQGLELGVYGAGEAASRAIVRDPAVDGEALAAQMGQGFLHGAAFGAGAGAGLGLLGAGASYVGGRVADAGRSAAADVGAYLGRQADAAGGFLGQQAERLRGLEGKITGAAPELLARGEGLVGQGLDKAAELTGRVTGRAAPEAATLGGKIDRLARTAVDVDKEAVSKALQSTGADTKILQKAEKMSPEVRQAIARQVVEELPAALGRDGKLLGHVDQAEAAILLRRRKGEALGAALDRIEEAAGGAGFNPTMAIRSARAEVVNPLRKTAGMGGYADRVESYLSDLQRITDEAPMGFKDFHTQRAALDDLIYEAKASRSPAQKALEKVRGILEESFSASAEVASKRAGTTAAAEYKALKAEYRAAKWVEEATAKGASRNNANRAYGLSEQLGGIAGAIAGGGGLTGMALGAGGAIVNRAVKQYADQGAAAVLREMSAGKTLAEAVATVTQRNIGEQAKKFVDLARGPGKELLEQGKGKARELVAGARKKVEAAAEGVKAGAKRVGEAAVAGAKRAGEAALAGVETAGRVGGRVERGALVAAEQRRQEEAFAAKRKAIVESQAMGLARVQATAKRFEAAGADPATAQAAAVTASKGADHLFLTLPQVPQRSQTLQPALAKDGPSPDDIDTWLRRAAVVDDPSVVLDGLGRGTVTPEELETLREVYPSYYQQVQDAVRGEVQRLTDEGTPLLYEQELVLEQLLGVTTSPTSDPAFVAAVQATFAPPAPPPTPPPASRSPQMAHLYSLETR